MTLLVPSSAYEPPWEDLLGEAYDAAEGTGGSNGAMPWPRLFLALATAVNHLAARPRIIPARTLAYALAPGTDDNWAVRWRQRYRSTQNGTELQARVVAAPAVTTAVAPAYSWDGGVTARRWDRRSAAATESEVEPITGLLGEIISSSVSRNAVQTIGLSTNDRLRLCGLALWETPRSVLDTGSTDTLLDYARFVGGRPVTDADWAAMLGAFRALWERWQKHLVAHTIDDQAAPHSYTPNAWVNLLDNTVVAWGAETPGWPLDLYLCGSMSETTVPVTVHAYASSASAGKLRLITSIDSVDINPIGAVGWYTATVNADPAIQTEKLDVHISGDAVNPCEVWSICAWVYRG